MGLTTEERTNAIAQFRFTEPQARFLDLVLRHAGVCVPRQYATVAGIANGGDKCNAFFEKLVRRHYAVASDCAHNRARVYHVHYKRLYAAIGEPQSPYRRPMPPHRAIERVMLLDAVIATPGVDWLTNESEKRGCLAKVTLGGSGEAHDGGATPSRRPSDRFAGRFPVGDRCWWAARTAVRRDSPLAGRVPSVRQCLRSVLRRSARVDAAPCISPAC
jgi:hypothetical protein